MWRRGSADLFRDVGVHAEDDVLAVDDGVGLHVAARGRDHARFPALGKRERLERERDGDGFLLQVDDTGIVHGVSFYGCIGEYGLGDSKPPAALPCVQESGVAMRDLCGQGEADGHGL